jgi:hypothetical protein
MIMGVELRQRIKLEKSCQGYVFSACDTSGACGTHMLVQTVVVRSVWGLCTGIYAHHITISLAHVAPESIRIIEFYSPSLD